jgi:hypothetical protein
LPPSHGILDTSNLGEYRHEDWGEGAEIMCKKARRILALLNDPRQKNRLLEALDEDATDAAVPVGKGEMTILKDMDSLDLQHDQYMQDLKSGGHSE